LWRKKSAGGGAILGNKGKNQEGGVSFFQKAGHGGRGFRVRLKGGGLTVKKSVLGMRKRGGAEKESSSSYVWERRKKGSREDLG